MATTSVNSRWRRAWRQVMRRLRPPRQLKTTTLGKIVIGFAIVIGVAATNTGNNLLYLVLGGLFGIIAASGVLSERMLKGLRVALHPPGVAVAGQPVAISVTVSAASRIDSFLLDLQLQNAQGRRLGQGRLREVLRGTRRTTTIRVQPEQRGRFDVAAVRVATRFPFQMYEKARLFSLPGVLWVAPRPESDQTLNLAPKGAEGTQARVRRNRDGSEFKGLRERQSSDALSRIHWKQTAATGQHVVKIFAANHEPQIQITLYRGNGVDAFETGLRQVAGIVESARRRERGVGILAGRYRAAMEADGQGWRDIQLLLAQVTREDVLPGAVVFERREAA